MQTRWNDGHFTTSLESLVWMASPVVRRYLHGLVSGNPNCDWLTFVEWRYFDSTRESALVLGCGSGWLERAVAERGKFRSIVACDFAADAVEKARLAAEEKGYSGIQYRVVNLEKDDLGGPYDAVFANDVLHHIENLEGLYARISRALAPGGRLIFNEYVGPDRFQYSDRRMKLVNRYFRFLPDRLRRDPTTRAVLWSRERLDRQTVESEDPTEAIRSQEVLPLARAAFRTEAEYCGGGGLLNPLLFGIITNFTREDPEDDRLLQTLCDAEDRLTRAAAIQPDFAIFVGRKQ